MSPQDWRPAFLEWVRGRTFDRHTEPRVVDVVALGLVWASYASNDGGDSYPGRRTLEDITRLDWKKIQTVRGFLVEHGWLVEDGFGPHGSIRVALSGGGLSGATEPPVAGDSRGPLTDHPQTTPQPVAGDSRGPLTASGGGSGPRSGGGQSGAIPPTSERKRGGGGEPDDGTAQAPAAAGTTVIENTNTNTAWTRDEVDSFVAGCGVAVYGDTRKAARRYLDPGYHLEHTPQLAAKFAGANNPAGAFIAKSANLDDPDEWLPSAVPVSYANPTGGKMIPATATWPIEASPEAGWLAEPNQWLDSDGDDIDGLLEWARSAAFVDDDLEEREELDRLRYLDAAVSQANGTDHDTLAAILGAHFLWWVTYRIDWAWSHNQYADDLPPLAETYKDRTRSDASWKQHAAALLARSVSERWDLITPHVPFFATLRLLVEHQEETV